MTDPFTEIVVGSYTVDEIHRLRLLAGGSLTGLTVVDRVRAWTERRQDWDVRQQRADELVIRADDLLDRIRRLEPPA